MQLSTLFLVAGASLASAHFGLLYPEWRADTLANEEEYSQWDYPCAGVPAGTGNRTDWPLGGGSLSVKLNHPWTYMFVNLGLGSNATNFNISLTEPFWNATGNGTLCIEKLALPADLEIEDGAEASIQVVTVGHSGSALYNCADITFRTNATTLDSDKCVTNNVTYVEVGEVNSSEGSNGSNSSSGSGNQTSDAASVTMATSAVAAAVMAVIYGLVI